MCFSATASFVTAGLLVPSGLYGAAFALRHDRRYLPLASFPLMFGIQQFVEGGLWLALGGSTAIGVDTAALGFLAFAYFLWPFYVPLAARSIEVHAERRRLFVVLALFGFALGASLYLPLLVHREWITVTLSKGSILYGPMLIYDGYVPRSVIRAFYALIVSVPLLFSSVDSVRVFGMLILFSVVGSAIAYAYAFVSVWCFFAALLSLVVIAIVRRSARPMASDDGDDGIATAHPRAG